MLYPIERLLRDTRLALIWTGTNEIMNLIIQHEFYKALAKETPGPAARDVEEDAAAAANAAEKVYE